MNRKRTTLLIHIFTFLYTRLNENVIGKYRKLIQWAYFKLNLAEKLCSREDRYGIDINRIIPHMIKHYRNTEIQFTIYRNVFLFIKGTSFTINVLHIGMHFNFL